MIEAVYAYLTPPETAALIRLTTKTLDNWRGLGKGPRYVKRGGRVIYRRKDVEDWLDVQTVTSTAEARAREVN